MKEVLYREADVPSLDQRIQHSLWEINKLKSAVGRDIKSSIKNDFFLFDQKTMSYTLLPVLQNILEEKDYQNRPVDSRISTVYTRVLPKGLAAFVIDLRDKSLTDNCIFSFLKANKGEESRLIESIENSFKYGGACRDYRKRFSDSFRTLPREFVQLLVFVGTAGRIVSTPPNPALERCKEINRKHRETYKKCLKATEYDALIKALQD